MPGTTTNSLARHYDLLDGRERFVAMTEAMARGDKAEEDRLDDACPRRACTVDDPAYRQRMRVAYTCAALACTAISRDLDVLRTLDAVGRVANIYRRTMETEEPELAEDAFVAVDLVLDAVRQTTGRRRASSLVSAWAGFQRFCNDCVGVDALTMARAWRLLDADPTDEVRRLCPDVELNEARAAGWDASLAGAWRKHVEAY
jgi:hypothetical protein